MNTKEAPIIHPMMHVMLWMLAVIMAALVEATWLGTIRLQGVLPDLVLILVVYLAMRHGEEEAMLAGFLGGLFQDVAGDAALGHHVLCLVLVGYGFAKLSRRLVTDHPAVQVGCVFLAALMSGTVFTLITYIQDPARGAIHAWVVGIVPSAFYTALVTPVLILAMDTLKQLLGHVRRRAV